MFGRICSRRDSEDLAWNVVAFWDSFKVDQPFSVSIFSRTLQIEIAVNDAPRPSTRPFQTDSTSTNLLHPLPSQTTRQSIAHKYKLPFFVTSIKDSNYNFINLLQDVSRISLGRQRPQQPSQVRRPIRVRNHL